MIRRIGIVILLLIVLSLGALAGWEYFRLNLANSELAAARAELLAVSTEADNLEVLNSLSKDVIDQLEQNQADNKEMIEGLSSEVDSLRGSMEARENTHERTIRELEERFICANVNLSPDYETNHSISETLLDFVSDINSQSVAVSSNYWKVFWTGAKFSHHTVEAFDRSANYVYLWNFIVFFDGEGSGDHANGIFWADQQCWLDLST